jgi:serine protease
MASPHVAGAAAMVEALGVTSAPRVLEVLASSARARGDRNLYGAGIVDAGGAVSQVFWSHLIARLIALGAVAWVVRRAIRKRHGEVACTVGAVVGTIVASVGVLPIAPVLGLASHAGRLRLAIELAMRPLGEWDMVLMGFGTHRWLLLASSLPAMVLASLGFSHARLRPMIGGVALGSAALLLQMAWAGDVAFVGGAVLARVWAFANLLVCMWLARLSLSRSSVR